MVAYLRLSSSGPGSCPGAGGEALSAGMKNFPSVLDTDEGHRGGGTMERAELSARAEERSRCENTNRARCVDVMDASRGVAGDESASLVRA